MAYTACSEKNNWACRNLCKITTR